MNEELSLILNVTAAIAIALLGGLLAHRLKQPAIVGYLLAGVAIGPFTPGFHGDQRQIAALAEVGVVFLMFALGIEFSLKELARVRAVAVAGTMLQVLITMAIGYGLGALFGWPYGEALFFGGIIAIASTMVILKTLMERGEIAAVHGRVLLGMLIVQDLVVVVLIVLLPRLVSGDGDLLPGIGVTLFKTVAFIAVTLYLGSRVVPGLMTRVERLGSAELFLLTAVTLALGTASISAMLGLSAALGAFLGGLLLTETEFDHRVIAEVVPMRNVFSTLFFVSVGMLIDPTFILANLGLVLSLAIIIVLAKWAGTFLALIPFRLGPRTLAFTSLGMIQMGEFSYLLAKTGHEVGAVPDLLYSLILTSSLATILATPLAFKVAPSFERLLSKLKFFRQSDQFGRYEHVGDYDGHALIVGYGRVGSRVATGLRALGTPVVVIEDDIHIVQNLVAGGVPAIYGDAALFTVLSAGRPESARIVVVSLPDIGTARTAVKFVRQVNADVPIVVRLPREDQLAALTGAGATVTVAPESAGADKMLEESLDLLGLEFSET